MATAKKFNVRHGLSAGTGTELKDVIDNLGKVIDVGTLPDLKTTAKTNTVAAINELYDGLVSSNLISETFEPMGVANRSQSVISFDNSTRTFTIAPTPGTVSFAVWTKATKRTYTSAQSVSIGASPATGLYYIYFDSSGVLSYRTTYFDWENDSMVAYVYWNATTNTAPFVADERHGIAMDWATHEYLHRTRGAVIANGFSISPAVIPGTGDGSVDGHAQFDLGNGTFFDEDLEVNITHSATPTTGTFTQILQGNAEIPVFYHSGVEGSWMRDVPTEFAAKQSATTLQYNTFSQGSWTTTPAADNRYVVSWIVATNEINYPILSILGQNQYSSIGEAEAVGFGDLVLTGFPIIELRPLWKVIFRTSSGYTNTPNAYIANILDIRQLSGESGSGSAVSDHGLLTGLVDDDHSQYVHMSLDRTITANHTITGTLGIGTVIDMVAYDNLNGGTLSWEASAGQLFSITNNLTSGSIFSVNDVSGLPSIDVDADGTISLGVFGGNVGIGTTDPIRKLHIHAPNIDLADIRLSGSATLQTPFDIRQGIIGVSNAGFSIYDVNAASTRLAIDSAGNVGIGTGNPAVKLDVSGSIRSLQTGAGTGILLHTNTGWSASSNLAQFWTGQLEGFAFYANDTGNETNERVRITASGNVGIGTASPGSKLSVNGYITESTDGGTTYWNVVTQQDVGTSPNQIPLNQYLGQLAFMDDFSPNGLRAEGASTDSVSVFSSGVTSFYSTSDYQIILNGNGTTWAGILFVDVNGSDTLWFNGQHGTFSLGGGGASVAGKKLHVDGGVSIGSSSDQTVMPINGLYVEGNIQTAGALHGPSNFVIDPAAVGDDTGTVEIKGNLTVQGTTTTINSTTVDLDNLALGDNEKFLIGNGGAGDNGGIVKDLEIYSDGSSVYFDSPYIYTGDAAVSPNIYFRTSAVTTLDTNALSILANGNIGIGIASPKSLLHVKSSMASETGVNSGFVTGALAGFYGGLRTEIFGAAVGNSVDTGIVHIKGQITDIDFNSTGTRETGRLVFSGRRATGAQSRVSNETVWDYNNQTAGSKLSFWTAPVSSNGETAPNRALTIDQVQNVGIGTANPTQKLHVNGSNTIALFESSSSYSDIRFSNSSNSNSFIGYYGTSLNFYANSTNTPTLTITGGSPGNVGIGTTNPGYKLEVNGSFAATTKSFIIPHPTKEGYKLRYGSLEGPENGVYVRGRSKESVIHLPDYWTKLVDEDSITVNLTPIGQSGVPRVERIEDNKIYIFTRDSEPLEYFYMVLAERADVEKLEVEVPEAPEVAL